RSRRNAPVTRVVEENLQSSVEYVYTLACVSIALAAQLDETGGGEVAVEGERLADPQRTHERETRGVHERVLSLVVLAEPAQRLVLEGAADELHAKPRRTRKRVDEGDGRRVAMPSIEKRPRFAADVVRGDEPVARFPCES